VNAAASEPIEIAALTAGDPGILAELAALLVSTVAAGGSVGFMHPLAASDAKGFWRRSLAAGARDERVVLGARCEGRLIATVTLLFAPWPNQPHRAEIAKLMTSPAHRGRGVASALMARAERIALSRGRTLLTLDTAEEDGAAVFYERLGYVRAGCIPGFALKPSGGETGTLIYYKRLG